MVVPSKYKSIVCTSAFKLLEKTLTTNDEYGVISKLVLTSSVNKYCPIEVPVISLTYTEFDVDISVSAPLLALPYKE